MKSNNPTGIGGFKPGQSGNPGGVSKDPFGNRPYRAALRMEAALAESGGRAPKVGKRSLRYLARQALERAAHNTAALEHVANRLDGPIIPAPDDPVSQSIVEIRVVMVEPHQITPPETKVINHSAAEQTLDQKAIEADQQDDTTMDQYQNQAPNSPAPMAPSPSNQK
jgi:hypothetical protein